MSATSTRRSALNADAELIRFSSRVVAVCTKMDALYAVRHTIEDEHRTQPQMDALRAERVQATDHIYDLPDPTTLAGARAMAIASLALAPRERDGSISYCGESERLAWVVAEFLAGECRDMTAHPHSNKAHRDRLLYNIAVAWLAARDEDALAEDDPPPVKIGGWDPCFKAGPCPCSSPCEWVAPLILPDGA